MHPSDRACRRAACAARRRAAGSGVARGWLSATAAAPTTSRRRASRATAPRLHVSERAARRRCWSVARREPPHGRRLIAAPRRAAAPEAPGRAASRAPRIRRGRAGSLASCVSHEAAQRRRTTHECWRAARRSVAASTISARAGFDLRSGGSATSTCCSDGPFLGLVELGDLVLAHHAFEQRLLQLQLAACAHVVDRRPPGSCRPACRPRCPRCRRCARFHARQLGAQRAQLGAEPHHVGVLLGRRRAQHLQLDLALGDLRAQLRGAVDQRLGLLVEHDHARTSPAPPAGLLGLDQVLLGVLQLLLEEGAAQLRLRDGEAAEHLGDLACVRVGELGGELRVLVVDLDA